MYLTEIFIIQFFFKYMLPYSPPILSAIEDCGNIFFFPVSGRIRFTTFLLNLEFCTNGIKALLKRQKDQKRKEKKNERKEKENNFVT